MPPLRCTQVSTCSTVAPGHVFNGCPGPACGRGPRSEHTRPAHHSSYMYFRCSILTALAPLLQVPLRHPNPPTQAAKPLPPRALSST
eukprot:2328244-Rhodomonas_salina.2